MKVGAASAIIFSALLVAGVSCAVPVAARALSTSALPSVSPAQPRNDPADSSASGANSGWLLCTWTLNNLLIQPATASVDDKVEIWSDIYIEELPFSYVHTYLLVNGAVIDQQMVPVFFDEDTPFCFNFTPDKPGTYRIEVRAILQANEVFAALPGGEGNFISVSTNLLVQA